MGSQQSTKLNNSQIFASLNSLIFWGFSFISCKFFGHSEKRDLTATLQFIVSVCFLLDIFEVTWLFRKQPLPSSSLSCDCGSLGANLFPICTTPANNITCIPKTCTTEIEQNIIVIIAITVFVCKYLCDEPVNQFVRHHHRLVCSQMVVLISVSKQEGRPTKLLNEGTHL